MRKVLAAAGLVAWVVLAACSSDPGDGAAVAAAGSGGSSGSGGTVGGSGAQGGTGNEGGGAGSSGSGGSAGSVTHDCQNPGPGWLFCDDFEAMAGGYDAWRNDYGWTDHIGADDPGRMTLSTDAHAGGYSVHYPAAAASGYQGADLIYRTCTGTNQANCALENHDRLYLRAYLKLAADHQRVHHFLNIGGSQQFWDAYGNAGCRPNGYRAMGTTVDFDAQSHDTFFYTYFPGMSCDSGASCDNYADAQAICDGCAQKEMPCQNGPECCWGNLFRPKPEVALPTGRWVCFEMMMAANDVGQQNGEMAYWIDGKLAHQEAAMEWRTTGDLGLNMVRLQHYVETSDAQGHSNQVWFDDVVISTERIGCM